MSELDNKLSENWANPESNQEILARQPESLKKIIESDPILRQNLDKITNPQEVFQKISENAQIFEQTDNPSAKRDFLIQLIKGLEYWQYASNGDSFDGFLQKHGNGAIDEAIKKRNAGEWSGKDYREFVKYQDRRDITANLSKTNEWKTLDQAAMKEAEMELKLKRVWENVDNAILALNEEGSKFIQEQSKKVIWDTQFTKALGIPSWQEWEEKYKKLILASVILWASEKPWFLEQYVNEKDKNTFRDSIKKIGELGIPYPVKSDIPSISAHIDSRFPKWESTERAKSEIERSITSENVSSIYYDGKWEKYTLIDKDGKTSKEVYMNPPKIRVAQAGFEAEEAIVPWDDTKRRVEKQNELWVIKGKTQEKIGKIWTDLTDVFQNKLPPENTEEYSKLLHKETFGENFRILQNTIFPTEKRIESTEKLIQAYREARDTPTINKDLYDRKIQELDEVKRSLQEEIKLQWVIAGIPTTSSEDFENNVKENFTTLSTDPRLYDRFPRPQELLTGILGEINRTRNTRNQIKIGEKILWQSEKRSIDEAYEKVLKYLGTDISILKSPEIGNIKPKITELLKNNNRELKRILANTEWQKSQTDKT